MPGHRTAVFCALTLLVPAIAFGAGDPHQSLRIEGGFPVPAGPTPFKTRYERLFSVRAVGEGVIVKHLSFRMSTGYSEFAHARTRTYVSGGGGWNLSSLWGLTVWPLEREAPVHPYLTVALGSSGFELKDVVIDTGTGPRKVSSAFKNGLGTSLELGMLAFQGASRWGMSVAAERTSVDSPMGVVVFTAYRAGLAYRYRGRQ